jgi:Tol biopolymer transport system component
VLSANGRIAMSTRTTARASFDLYLVDPAGGAPVRLTRTPGVDESWPAFSADGRQLAFVRCRCGGKDPRYASDRRDSDIFAMTLDETGPGSMRRVTRFRTRSGRRPGHRTGERSPCRAMMTPTPSA